MTANAAPEKLYLTPNSNWKSDGARFAAYFFGNGEKWVSMTAVAGETDLYEVTTPAGYPKVIFCRMNPSASANNWSNKWNQTGDLTIPTDGKNHFTVSSGSWDGATSKWSTYTPPTYTIVGAETLVGAEWDVANTANDMTKQSDGSYVLVKENVELATTGTYEYKVVKNHSWDWSIPSGAANQTLKLGNEDVDGTYNVTFTLNKDLNALTASLELVEAKKVIPECYVAGDESLTGQDWNAKSVSMTYDEATEVYTATLTAVPAGTHNMKVVYGGEWLGFDHLATPVPANVTEGDDKKIQFTLAEAGDITVTYHATNGIGLTGNFAAPIAHTYTVAGDAALCGEAWNWELAANDMTNNGDGTYTWTKEGVELKATLGFKIFVDHASGTAYPQENWNINPENYEGIAVYTVTITFTESSKEVAVSLTKTGDVAPPVISYVLMGVDDDWTTGIALTRNEANTEFEEYMLLGQAISATDAVKVVKLVDGVKNTFCGDVKEGSAEHTADADGNIVLAEGTYDFYYDVPANKVYIGKQVTPTLVTPSVESGIFSVAEGKYVQFSTGNLQYEVGTNTWSFASEQYEVIGDEAYTGSNNTNYGMNVPGYTGKLDLFGWSCDGKYGVNPSNEDADYTGAFADWGNLVDEAGWYTLTKDEMNYILGRKKDGKKLWALATVCGMNGLILLPDNWNTSITLEYGYIPANFNYTKNQIDAATWQTLEAAGAVFLPEGGTRVGGYGNKEQGGGPAEFDSNGDYFHVDNVGEMGYYWLNSTTSEKADYLILPGWSDNGTPNDESDDKAHAPQVWSREKRRGNSVRLVKEVTPDYTRTVTPGNYGTICLEFGSTNYTGMELYEFVGKEEGKAYLGSVTTLVAGVPYIFQATATELAVYSDGTTAATPGEHNGLVGTFTDDTEVTIGNYILFNNAICEVTATCWVNANRAYIVWDEIPTGAPQQMPGRKYIGMDVTSENEATGLDNITNGKNTTLKLIENGQLIIIRNGEKFNAQGVRF